MGITLYKKSQCITPTYNNYLLTFFQRSKTMTVAYKQLHITTLNGTSQHHLVRLPTKHGVKSVFLAMEPDAYFARMIVIYH